MGMCDSMGNGCPIPADWWNVGKNVRESGQGFLDWLQQINDDLNSDDPGRQARAALELALFLGTVRAGRGEDEISLRPKPINLPAWRDVGIDIDHVLAGHTEGGLRSSPSKDLFPSTWNSGEIESAIRNAYRYSGRIRSQGDKVLVVGPGPVGTNMRIIMWVNKRTRTIESAYPDY